MSKITWRTRKYQIGERKRWKRPLLRLLIFEFEQNIRKSLFLPAVYTPFEINSIPAILGIKVSDKNFQPTFDHKKKKRQKRSLWNRWNRYVFRIFIEALSSMGYPMDFKKRQKNRDSNAEKITRIPVTAREKKKTQLAIYFFLSVDQREMKFPVVLGGLP